MGVRWHPLNFEFNSTIFFGVAGHRSLGGHQPVTLLGSCTPSGDDSKYWESRNLHDCLHVGNCPCCNSGLSFEPGPLLHILFGLNLLTSCKNSATSGSTCLSNIPLYACRTSSTCWIVTTKFHTFFQTALRFGPSVTLRFQTLNFKAIFGIAFLCFV